MAEPADADPNDDESTAARWIHRAACRTDNRPPCAQLPGCNDTKGDDEIHQRAGRQRCERPTISAWVKRWIPNEKHKPHQSAYALCHSCPVRVECVEESIAFESIRMVGIFGGLGSEARRHLRKLRRPGHTYEQSCRCAYCQELAKQLGLRRQNRHTRIVTDRNGAGARHGFRSTYARGCRCTACTLESSLAFRLSACSDIRDPPIRKNRENTAA